MLPVIGNHEYQTPGAAGYFGYFGAAAAGPGGYYALDAGTWRVYVINSECSFVGCGSGSAQLAWLTADLAANPRSCVLALWHEPRFSSGAHGDATAMAPIWSALHTAGAELVLSGHDHDYERLLPMDPSGPTIPTTASSRSSWARAASASTPLGQCGRTVQPEMGLRMA